MRNGLMVLSTFAMLMSSAFAGDVVLHLKSDAVGPEKAIFKLGSVAKIQQDLKLTLSNGGFSAQTIDAADPAASQIETFGFGSVDAFPSEVKGERLAINPLASDIELEVCGDVSSPAYHMQKLISGSLKDDGTAEVSPTKVYCTVTGTAGSRVVAAGFTSRYKLDSAGGMKGILELFVDNGVDKTLDAASIDAELAMLTATIANESTAYPHAPSLADVSILLGGSGAGRLLDQGEGQISYEVGFAIDGAQARPEKRVSFSHELSLNI